MPKVLEIKSGKVYDLPTEQAVELTSRDGYRLVDGEKLNVKTTIGVDAQVSPEDYQAQVDRGERAETLGEEQNALHAQRMEDEHGGLGGKAITALEHGVDTFTLGGYGAAARAIAPEYNQRRIERTITNPGTALAADLGSLAVGGIGAAGKGALGKATRLTPYGKMVAMSDKAVHSGKALRGLAVEGLVEGAAQELQALTLSEDPLTLERVGSQMGTGGLLGMGTGFGIGVFGKAATKGVLKAKKIVTGERVAADAARGEKLITSASEDALQLVEDFKAHQASDIDAIGVMFGAEKNVLTKQRGDKGRMVKLLDDSTGLAERPSGMLSPLRKEAQLLEEGLADTEKLMARGAKHDAEILAELDKLAFGGPLKGKVANAYGDFMGQKLTRKVANAGINPPPQSVHAFRAALSDGTMAARRAETIKRLPDLLDANRAMQQRVLDVIEAGKTQKAGFLENAITGAAFTAGTGAASAVLPDQAGFLAPMAGAAAAGKMNALLFGRMGKASKVAAERTQKAIDNFLNAGKAARRLAVPVATKVLAEASFGEPDPEYGPKPKETPTSDKLYTAYRAREREIYGQVQGGPNGPVMRRDAREKLYNNLAGVRAVSPEMADALETQHAKKIEFIAAKLPKRPDSAAMRLGPDTWRPSDMAIRELARYVAAIEDPQGVFERVADGTVTPEDGEAVREVYPQQFRDFQERVMSELPNLRERLDYQKRLALSIFTGVPVDPAMDPRILSLLQSNFSEEVGAGNEAPRANPQFGSVSKPEPTPGQKRAG